MSNLYATPKAKANYLNKKKAVYPESSDFRDGHKASGHWYDVQNNKVVVVEQVVGGSGVYLITSDHETNETIRDDRPWQIR